MIASRVQELPFHTMICLRSSPGLERDTSIMMSNTENTTRTTPKKIIAPIGICVPPVLCRFDMSNSFDIFSIAEPQQYVKSFLHFLFCRAACELTSFQRCG